MDREQLIAAFERALLEIPTVRAVRVGRRITHGANYELRAPNVADFLIVLDFDDLRSLQAYLEHPAHMDLGARFNQSSSGGLVYDFELASGVRSFLEP
jgi:hypothetical protein